MRKVLFFLIFLGTIPVAARAEQPILFQSDSSQTALLEVYSSEGCSSCPPAERWVGSLQGTPGLWKDYVPAVMHVTYWDRLGWKDRFANRNFDSRQRQHSRSWQARTVYTPGFVVDGKEWARWYRDSGIPASKRPTGVLTVVSTREDTFFIRYDALPGQGSEWEAHAALLGFGIESSVKAGENVGRLLKHDFIVLEHRVKSLEAKKDLFEGSITLDRKKWQEAKKQGLAVWVSRKGQVAPIQATGGYLPS